MQRAGALLIVLALLVPLMSARPAAADGTASASFNGFLEDRVSSGNSAVPDGFPDGTLSLSLSRAGSHRVTSIELMREDGGGVWTTKADSGYWVLGVSPAADAAPLLNHPDKSIDVAMTDSLALRLYASGEGYFSGGWSFTITACFDGSATDCASATAASTAVSPPITEGGPPPPPPSGAVGPDALGTSWEECETHTQTFCYTFVRQGTSTTWTAALHNGETATLIITLDGSTVTIQRRDSNPDNPLVATYTGTLDGDQVSGSVTWWYEDTPELSSTGIWNATIFGAAPADGLGTRWEECETGTFSVCGSFERQGTSNTWTANWNNGSAGTLTISPDGGSVTIQRQDPDGLQATYTGTINGNQVVDGAVTWWYDPANPSTGTWVAIMFPGPSTDVLGTRWEECETHTDTFCGTFIRQEAGSNTWYAGWNNGAYGMLTITLDGSSVTIQRQDPDGLQATYTGTISGDQASGSVTWWYDPALTSTGTWNATIFGTGGAATGAGGGTGDGAGGSDWPADLPPPAEPGNPAPGWPSPFEY